jgi:hypothetical protein
MSVISTLKPGPSKPVVLAPIEVRPTGCGFGVFALDTIRAGECILLFERRFIDAPTTITLRVDEDLHQISTDPRAAENFVNHSCDPSALIEWSDLSLVAKREILPGEQVTYDYMTSDWDGEDPFHCQCGAEQCRESIRGFRHLTLAQQEKVRHLASPYIQKMSAGLLSKDC